MKPIAISLFDYTGKMLEPWLEAGYECHIFDNQHKRGSHDRGDGMMCHGVDLTNLPLCLLELLGPRVAFCSAFVPCTDVSVSGAKHFAGKGLRALEQSIALFATAAEFLTLAAEHGAGGFIENPRSTLSTYWREPNEKFNPSDYSGYTDAPDDYTKETWLWTFGSFLKPPRNRAGDLFDMPDEKYIHFQPPGKERANIRSATPMGFATAVHLANSNECQRIFRKHNNDL
jgi:hypothetical protein